MSTKRLVNILLLALMVGWFSWGASADEVAVQGRGILEAHRSAVVTVKLVTKMSFGGRGDEETPQEVTGTVLDATGLTVVSLTETDPTNMIRSMMGAMADSFDMSSEVTDVKIVPEDGVDIPAKVILRDKDLDLAFVRPAEEPAEPMPHIDMSQDAAPEILEPLVLLNRLGKVARRAYAAELVRVKAVVDKPRTFYVTGGGLMDTSLGTPVFTLDGQFVGVNVLRMIKAQAGGISGMFGGLDDSAMAIIIPGQDILEAATQAPPFGQEEAAAPAVQEQAEGQTEAEPQEEAPEDAEESPENGG